MREKELRLALVCYGGVSLAVYMHGITKEVWKLSRASLRRRCPTTAALSAPADSETAYHALFDALAPHVSLRVFTDIIAGASAGGINGILLAQAISQGSDLESLRELWLAGADSDKLLDPDAAAKPWSKWWAMPLIWYAKRVGLVMSDMAEPDARAEVSVKLSRLMRSRWFKPPFSGLKFASMIYDALLAMEQGPQTPPLLPPGQPLDLFVTVTDYHGQPSRLRLHSPPEIIENENRLIIGFNDPGPDLMGHRHLADRAELTFAARATACFPGAFPPARVGEIDKIVTTKHGRWHDRSAFLARIFPGSVLNNRPFGPAIEALGRRPAHREVDRRFVYIDPKPGMHSTEARDSMVLPGFFSTVLRSLADIPRQQPINDNLAAIEALSTRLRRLRHILEGMQAQVDSAIERAVGPRFFLFKLTPQRLADWRSRTQTLAAREAGFAYAAYGQLKMSQIVDSAAERLAMLGGGELEPVRHAIWNYLRERGIDHPAQATARNGAASEYVTFLRSFDSEFRIRRLRFVIRRANALAESLAADDPARAAFDRVKSDLYAILQPLTALRRPQTYDSITRHNCRDAASRTPEALAALESAMNLKQLDAECDDQLTVALGAHVPAAVRRPLLRAYLGFPFYDIALLPLMQEVGMDELDEIKVDRMSPDDATALRACGGGQLKGAQFNAFGAFFSRAYREHDYLWGRLHAAERLIDIVASTAPDGVLAPPVLAGIKRQAFRAIVAAETPHLKAIPEQLAALHAALDTPN
jgi:patatin-related protein